MSSESLIHRAKLNEWAYRFSDQKSNSLSVQELCDANNVTRYAFYYWKHLLKEELVKSALPDIVPLAIPDVTAPVSQPAIIPDTIANTRASCATFNSSPSARIILGDVAIELDESVSEEFIFSLIKAVRHV